MSDDSYDVMAQKYNDLFKKHDLRWSHKPEQHYTFGLGGMGLGWYDMLDRLIVKLIGLGWNREVGQIKEKFGGLRFYIGEGSNEVFKAIADAEDESFKTCEECGKPGTLRGGSWLRTLCPEHAGDRPEVA